MNLPLLVLLLLLPTGVVEASWANQGRVGPAISRVLGQAPPGWSSSEIADRMVPVLRSSKALKKVRELWQKGNLERAAKLLNKALAMDMPPEQRRSLRFLLARIQLDAELHKAAAAGFAKCAADGGGLADWCRHYQGLSLYRMQEYAKAASAWASVGDDFVKARGAAEMECISLFHAGDFSNFDGCAAKYGSRHKRTGTLLVMQAQRALARNAYEEAASLVKEIRVRMPSSGSARDAKSVAAQIEKKGFASHLELSPKERLDRGWALYEGHNHAQAIRVADKLMNDSKEKSEIWCKALGLQAQAWARKREQTRSMPFFDDFVKKCEPYFHPKILYRGVEAARKAGKQDFAVKWADVLAAKFPEATYCEDALLFVARIHDRAGDVKDVTAVVERILRDFPAGDMVPDAAWLLVWSFYKDGKYDEALAAIERLAPKMPAQADYRSDGRLDYWAGRILLKQKKPKEARASFEEVLRRYPMSWYGLLSYLRLEQQKKGRGGKALAVVRKESVATLPDLPAVLAAAGEAGLELERVFLFLRLELFEEAQEELERTLVGADSSVHARLLAAFLYDRAGRFPLSHNLLRRKLPEYRYTYPQDQDSRWWQIAYPYPFRDLIELHGKGENVPWNMIVGIMREESGFNPVVESYAHALGLMQLLQKTASWVAGKQISRRRLRIPAENIPLGAKYLRYLLDKFNHPALAVSGYNSGPGGVYKTLKRTRNREIDEFVEHIPYDQTRRYTKRVLSSAWSYQLLYGNKGGVIPFNLRFPKQK
jgi:soluble lytic murein transglycosylase